MSGLSASLQANTLTWTPKKLSNTLLRWGAASLYPFYGKGNSFSDGGPARWDRSRLIHNISIHMFFHNFLNPLMLHTSHLHILILLVLSNL